jgi:cytoskeletal protein RodZ
MTDHGPGSIGQALRNRRLQKSLTLENVMAAIRVQPRFLKALEEERWDDLPARVFLEGFLVKYAEFLGLDGKEILGELLERLGKVDQPAFNNPQPIPETIENDSLVPLRLGLFLAAVLIVAAGGFFFLRRQGLPGPSLERPLNQVSEPEPVVLSSSTSVTPVPGEPHRASRGPWPAELVGCLFSY